MKRNSHKRNVPMVRVLVAYLSELKKRATFTGPDDPVFVGRTGRPVDQHNEFNRKLKPIAESLGMPWVGWHTFRRTHTTLADQHAMSMSDRMANDGARIRGYDNALHDEAWSGGSRFWNRSRKS